MKPSVMITSPGSPDVNTIYRSRTSRMMHPSGNSSIGGRIQVSFLLVNLLIVSWWGIWLTGVWYWMVRLQNGMLPWENSKKKL